MSVIQLRANTPFVLRVGYNDHRSVLDALRGREVEGARVPIDVLVVEGHWAQRHRDLVDEAATHRQLIIDYRVDLWTLGDKAPALPKGRLKAFSVEEIDRDARVIVQDALAAQKSSHMIVAPGCHIDDLDAAAWSTTLHLLDEMIHQAGMVPCARIVGMPTVLATREGAARVIEALHERHVDQMMLTAGPIAEDSDGENLLRLVRAATTAGIRVHLTHQGPLGLAALAVGAQSFDAGLLGRGETFDYERERVRLNTGGWGRTVKRSYVAPLMASVSQDIVGKLVNLKAVRAALECDGPCCATRIDGAILYPVTHFVVRRCAQVRGVLDMPAEMRRNEVEKLYGQANNIYRAIRGAHRADGNALEPNHMDALRSQIAQVRAANRQLQHAMDSPQWAASGV